MLHTVIVNTRDNQELVFKHVLYFVAEPGLIKMLRRKWIEVEGVQGIILHEEHGLIDEARKEFADALKKDTAEMSEIDKQQAIINHVIQRGEKESDMSRLSDDEKRCFTDQVSMLKNENERLVKYYEDVLVESIWMRREIERVGYALYTGTKTGYVGTEEDLQAIGQNVEGVCETNERLMNVEAEIDAMRDFMALLYLGIREGRDEAFELLDDKTKHLINEVWFERLEEDADDEAD